MNILQSIQSRFQPDLDTGEHEYIISRQSLAFGVGLVAFGLPIALLLGLLFGACGYDSISHYYYSRFTGDLFVGALFFIGAFLLAYRGESKWENRLSKIAGFCAFGVAAFPTAGDGCARASFAGRAFVMLEQVPPAEEAAVAPGGAPFQLFPGVNVIHFGSASLLFAILAVFCLFVFTRALRNIHRRGDDSLTPEKRRRNRIYVGCGLAIVATMAVVALNARYGADWDWWDAYNLTFVAETVMLWAFGLSWAVKGRFGPARHTRFGRMLLDDRDYEDRPLL